MALDINLALDLGDGELHIAYDSGTSPLGVTLSMTTDANKIEVTHIDLGKLDRLADLCRRIIALAVLEDSDPDAADMEDPDDDELV